MLQGGNAVSQFYFLTARRDLYEEIMRGNTKGPCPLPAARGFNQAAMQTRDGTIARLKKNKGMAGLLPAGKLKREVISGFDKSIQKGQTKLSEINDLEEQTKIRASIATMKKYKEVVGKLSF